MLINLAATAPVFAVVAFACPNPACAADVSIDSTAIRGITGRISDAEIAVPASKIVAKLSNSRIPRDINLKRMSWWSLNYLARSPRKRLGYSPVFNCFPYQCPPAPEEEDPIVPCDTDARMDWEWYYMRDITGSTADKDIEAAFHKRMRSYIDDEGYVWSPPGCYNEGDIHAKYEKKDYLIHMWGTTKLIRSLSEDYARTGNPESKSLARKVVLAAKSLATWDDKGRCWFACGMGGFKSDKKTPVMPSSMPAPIVGPLVTYWQVTGDKEGLTFAKAAAEGIINNCQPNGIKFEPDGNFGSGHGHITMHAVWGVAELGLATGEKKYIDFAKRSFDWMLSRGTGTGWFPAAPQWASNCTELCLISDMMSTAACIAQSGHPEYYDYIERYMRNYVSNLQFVATPEFETKYMEMNKTKGEETVRKGLTEAKTFQGGFYNAGLNDFENDLLGRAGYVWKIAGCCAPEGIRAVYTTWMNSIIRLPETRLCPSGVYVNMSFSRDSKWGKIVSFLPNEGRLTVQVKTTDRFFLRPPHWVPDELVNAFVNTIPVPVKWAGDYVRFDAKKGDEITITYPIISFRHDVDGLWAAAPDLHITYFWNGNMVTGVEPPAKSGTTPFFTGKVRVLPPAPGEHE